MLYQMQLFIVKTTNQIGHPRSIDLSTWFIGNKHNLLLISNITVWMQKSILNMNIPM
jgi:hypothetical protein